MEKKVTYKLDQILLLQSVFTREFKIDFTHPDLNTNLNLDDNYKIDGNQLIVILTLNFETTLKEKKLIISTISMAGIFEFTEKIEEGPLSIQNFASINAPAIIFPFIREHFATLTMKAGLKPILLPPVNFVEFAKQKKEAQ